MNLEEIKAAVRAGKKVHWKSRGYEVIEDRHGAFLIVFVPTGNCVGLTWRDGVTMNEDEADFFIAEPVTA